MNKKYKLRCFISLNFPEEIINKIINIQKQIKNDKLFSGKTIESSNLHLTLKFLGEIDQDKINEVRKILNEINFNKINVSFDNIGAFSKQDIRIIWVKLNGVEELQKEIDTRLNGLFKMEKRFMAHITLFRIKEAYNTKEFFNHLYKIKFDKIKFLADNFYLMHSSLDKTGVVYSEIEKYDLESSH